MTKKEWLREAQASVNKMSLYIDQRIRDLYAADVISSFEKAKHTPREELPYPWCYGAPTKENCIKRGYCRRNPSCGD